jgi:hypothetical protein
MGIEDRIMEDGLTSAQLTHEYKIAHGLLDHELPASFGVGQYGNPFPHGDGPSHPPGVKDSSPPSLPTNGTTGHYFNKKNINLNTL